ncbi:MAG: hypothetical protein CL843_00850 [Crocinitomicaceae bacterium]|nr:hypothetical protein [Crocinitomicaceae bacterium]|tara:strand:+ start:8268 stop:9035 length:768 start_codon:yes stop_codon:yes gene_type:complete
MNNHPTSRLSFFIFSALLVFTATSCHALWLKYSGVLEAKPTLKTISNGQKNVVYLALHHIGRKEYYADLTQKVDSLQQLNYVVFYEEITSAIVDNAELITLSKKFRKIQGNFEAGNGYLDTINNKIYGSIEYDKKYTLVNQPDFFDMGIDSTTALNADVKLEELIGAFEEKNGTITLSECDINTSLDAAYTCEPLRKQLKKDFKQNFVLGMRNENLAECITHNSADKIFVIYGAMHFKGLVKELKAIDQNWKVIK